MSALVQVLTRVTKRYNPAPDGNMATIQFLRWQIASLKISVKLSSLWAEVFKVFLVSSLGKNISIHTALETYRNAQVKLSLTYYSWSLTHRNAQLGQIAIHSTNKSAANSKQMIRLWTNPDIYNPFDLTRTRDVGLFKTRRRDLPWTAWRVRSLDQLLLYG